MKKRLKNNQIYACFEVVYMEEQQTNEQTDANVQPAVEQPMGQHQSEESSEILESDMGDDDAMDVEDLAEYTDDKLEALINLLVKKGLITEEELNQEIEKLMSE